MMKKIVHFSLSCIAAFAIILTTNSCSSDDEGPVTSNLTITQTLLVESNLSTLSQAIELAGLSSDLNGTLFFTLLAPDDAAFSRFFNANGFPNGLSDFDTPDEVALLRQILLYHVSEGSVRAEGFLNVGAAFFNTLSVESPNGARLSMFFNTINSSDITLNGGESNGGAVVTRTNIPASNGTIHVVDEVIALPTITSLAVANIGLTSLVAALTRSDQPDFAGILAGTTDSPFTVFAPTNDAFTALINSNSEWNSLEDIPTELLTSVLQHHVIAGNNIVSSAISNGLVSPATLEGDTLTFSVVGDIITIEDGSGVDNIQIVVANIQTSNGVIHVIENVLIPDTTN
ncbi:fasciclin domain-containing protein [Ascidiimonas sp. W6]|uniref:fasciclin domain-containing protein n=1 Tax=Ascidiimonas meishanensis TaxID=3128903 RepID=UPI0030EC53BE